MTYSVHLARDENGWWVADIPEVTGCHTQGRSIQQALGRIRCALDACGEDGSADLRTDIEIPEAARGAVSRYVDERTRLDAQRESARAAAEGAVATLIGRLGLSVRDAGALLGLSHQRIHQLAHASPRIDAW